MSMFEFTGRVKRDVSKVTWDAPMEVSVYASTRSEAWEKVHQAIGDINEKNQQAPGWMIVWTSIEEVPESKNKTTVQPVTELTAERHEEITRIIKEHMTVSRDYNAGLRTTTCDGCNERWTNEDGRQEGKAWTMLDHIVSVLFKKGIIRG